MPTISSAYVASVNTCVGVEVGGFSVGVEVGGTGVGVAVGDLGVGVVVGTSSVEVGSGGFVIGTDVSDWGCRGASVGAPSGACAHVESKINRTIVSTSSYFMLSSSFPNLLNGYRGRVLPGGDCKTSLQAEQMACEAPHTLRAKSGQVHVGLCGTFSYIHTQSFSKDKWNKHLSLLHIQLIIFAEKVNILNFFFLSSNCNQHCCNRC